LLLRWRGCDAQCEEPRGEYIADLISAAGHFDYLRFWLFRLLRKRSSYWGHYSQRASTVLTLARQGDADARKAVYRCFQDGGEEAYLAKEIVTLDGLRGLRWILDASSFVSTHERAWELDSWREEAEKVDGKKAVDAFFESDPLLQDLSEREADKQKPPPPVNRSFEEFRRSYLRNSPIGPLNPLEWAKTATPKELQKAAADLLVATDPRWLRALTYSLKGQCELIDVPAVIEKARWWLGEGHNPYIQVLERIESPVVREFGLDLLSRDSLDGLDLLERNAAAEDLVLVHSMLPSFETIDSDKLHGVVLALLQMCHRSSDDNRVAILDWLVEHSPCSLCRESAVRDLVECGGLTTDQMAELQWDCVPETRQMARNSEFRTSISS
jgi:hypothetical protein